MRWIRACITLIFLFITACNSPTQIRQSTFQTDNRLIESVEYAPRPTFIHHIVVYWGRLFFEEELCVGLNMEYLWSAGFDANTLNDHFLQNDNIIIQIDEQRYSMDSEQVYGETGLSLTFVYDETGQEVIGSYSDLANCVDITGLADGHHHFIVEIVDVSGMIHEFDWSIVITTSANDP